MSGTVSPPSDLAGILPAVISGGRPALKHRPTAKLLGALEGVTADPVWVVRDDDASGYEADGHELVVYTRAWADEWARAHWTGIDPWRPGCRLGAFPGREWACRIAAERGHWGVFQLDDNLIKLTLWTGHSHTRRLAMARGGLALFADLLAAVTLASNSWMTGASMGAVSPEKELAAGRKVRVARAGFPYSVFVERVGDGREPWLGPFEDDILHAYQYGVSAGPATASLVLALRYMKETTKASGMRPAYQDHKRAVGLQRAAPEMAILNVRSSTANGRGQARVFHTMRRGAIRTPLVVTDPVLWAAAEAATEELAAALGPEYARALEAKVERRARRAAARVAS